MICITIGIYLVSFILTLLLHKLDIWLDLDIIDHDYFKEITYGNLIMTIIIMPIFFWFTFAKLQDPIMKKLYNNTFLSNKVFKKH